MKEKKTLLKGNKVDVVLAIVAAVLIIVFAVVQKQSFIKTLPTLVTIYVQILMVRANRTAFLVGGVNSVLYSISKFSEKLYFSGAYDGAVSFPLMLVSYFNWKKNEQNAAPKIVSLKNKTRLLLGGGMILAWILCVKLLGSILSDGRFIWLDCFCFVGGLVVTLLYTVRCVDAQYLNVACSVVALVMWIAICLEDPRNINFVIISVYNLYKVLQMAISWTNIANKQKECAVQ